MTIFACNYIIIVGLVACEKGELLNDFAARKCFCNNCRAAASKEIYQMIIINGTSLTVEQVAAVARTGEQVAISDEAKAAVNKARAYVEKKLDDEKAVVYGLTTGFGKFSDKYIPLEDTAALQRNLIISHSCGMGNPLPTEVVRAAMLLRCNALCRGNSGIRLSTIETLLSQC